MKGRDNLPDSKSKAAFFKLLDEYRNFLRANGLGEIDFCWRCPVQSCRVDDPNFSCDEAIFNFYRENSE